MRGFGSVKRAFITGITGQDGAYLTRFLISKGYEVHGLVRRSSLPKLDRLEHLIGERVEEIHFHFADMSDGAKLRDVIASVGPDEVYNLAAQSHVGVSFSEPHMTFDVNAHGTLRLLDALRVGGLFDARFYQASTSELFGRVQRSPQNEDTPFYPRSPYGVSKLASYWAVVNYREAHGMFGCNGILFNHESPLRGSEFVTRKITRGLAGLRFGKGMPIRLGNLDAKRDWGHANDYVRAQWLMLQQKQPHDLVIATGTQHSVRDFVERAAATIGWAIRWDGVDEDEVGFAKIGNKDVKIVEVDPQFYRPAEVDTLLGDPTMAKANLGWEPEISFDQLVDEMMEYDLGLIGSK